MDYTSLINEYDLLIKKIAHKFYKSSFEDLYQVGTMGLIKAYNNFDNKFNIKFSTYAYKYIFGEMYNYLVINNIIKVNKNVLKMYKLIESTREKLINLYNREISETELIAYLNISYDEYLSCIMMANSVLSMDYQTENTDLYNYISDDSYTKQDDLIMLREAINELDSESKELIMKRYYYDYSQEEVANMLGISQVTVSRHEKKLIKTLNEKLV